MDAFGNCITISVVQDNNYMRSHNNLSLATLNYIYMYVEKNILVKVDLRTGFYFECACVEI